jgi:hypothetical protein
LGITQQAALPNGVISAKLRCIAVLAGCFSTAFGAAAFGSPFLILGAIVQPRATTSGRWLMWVGALLLSLVAVPFGPGVIVELAYSLRHGEKIGIFLIFVVATALVLCCDVALIGEARTLNHHIWVRGSLDRLVWIAATVLTAVCVWTSTITADVFKHGIGPRFDNLLLVVGLNAIVVLFDVALIIHAIKTRRSK